MLGVLAVGLLGVALVGVWTRSTVASTERVGELADATFADDEVQASLAAYLTTLAFDALDVEDRVAGALPDQLDRLGAAAVARAQSAIDRAVVSALDEPAIQRLLGELARTAHASALRLLRGDGLLDGVTVADGTVTVNLLPLLGRAVQPLQQLGLLQGFPGNDLTFEGDPTAQIAAIESALGRDLPDDFGQVVVYETARLASAQASVQRAQELVVLAVRALWLALILGVVFVAASIVLARDRWRAVVLLALGLAAAMVLLRVAVDVVVDDAPQLAVTSGGQSAISIVVGGLGSDLQRLAVGVLVAAGVVAAAAGVALGLRRASATTRADARAEAEAEAKATL